MTSNVDGGTDEAAVTPHDKYHYHASSLHSPRGVSPTRDYDFAENNDLAVQCVQRINCELRGMKGRSAEALAGLMTSPSAWNQAHICQYNKAGFPGPR